MLEPLKFWWKIFCVEWDDILVQWFEMHAIIRYYAFVLFCSWWFLVLLCSPVVNKKVSEFRLDLAEVSHWVWWWLATLTSSFAVSASNNCDTVLSICSLQVLDQYPLPLSLSVSCPLCLWRLDTTLQISNAKTLSFPKVLIFFKSGNRIY